MPKSGTSRRAWRRRFSPPVRSTIAPRASALWRGLSHRLTPLAAWTAQGVHILPLSGMRWRSSGTALRGPGTAAPSIWRLMSPASSRRSCRNGPPGAHGSSTPATPIAQRRILDTAFGAAYNVVVHSGSMCRVGHRQALALCRCGYRRRSAAGMAARLVRRRRRVAAACDAVVFPGGGVAPTPIVVPFTPFVSVRPSSSITHAGGIRASGGVDGSVKGWLRPASAIPVRPLYGDYPVRGGQRMGGCMKPSPNTGSRPGGP